MSDLEELKPIPELMDLFLIAKSGLIFWNLYDPNDISDHISHLRLKGQPRADALPVDGRDPIYGPYSLVHIEPIISGPIFHNHWYKKVFGMPLPGYVESERPQEAWEVFTFNRESKKTPIFVSPHSPYDDSYVLYVFGFYDVGKVKQRLRKQLKAVVHEPFTKKLERGAADFLRSEPYLEEVDTLIFPGGQYPCIGDLVGLEHLKDYYIDDAAGLFKKVKKTEKVRVPGIKSVFNGLLGRPLLRAYPNTGVKPRRKKQKARKSYYKHEPTGEGEWFKPIAPYHYGPEVGIVYQIDKAESGGPWTKLYGVALVRACWGQDIGRKELSDIWAIPIREKEEMTGKLIRIEKGDGDDLFSADLPLFSKTQSN